MSRAEAAAMKAYPVKEEWIGNQYGYMGDVNGVSRIKYIEGYEQAERDITIKVKYWLAEIHRVCDITDEHGYHIELRDLMASLEKTLEE